MMSLLLTFFILLFSMSEVRSNDKVKELMGAMQCTFGKHPAPVSPLPVGIIASSPQDAPASPQGKEKKRSRSRTGLDKAKVPNGDDPMSQTAAPRHLRRNRTLGLVRGGFRPSDRRRARRAASGGDVGPRQAEQDRRSGHTSRKPLPYGSRYHNDWELAFARCSKAADYLVSLGVDRERIELDVVGASEPAYRGADEVLLRENSARRSLPARPLRRAIRPAAGRSEKPGRVIRRARRPNETKSLETGGDNMGYLPVKDSIGIRIENASFRSSGLRVLRLPHACNFKPQKLGNQAGLRCNPWLSATRSVRPTENRWQILGFYWARFKDSRKDRASGSSGSSCKACSMLVRAAFRFPWPASATARP